MGPLNDYSNAEYPKWLELIDRNYSVIMLNLFKKLDDQLISRVKERSSKCLYDEFCRILKVQLDSNQIVNPRNALLEAVLTIYGYEVGTIKFLNKNTEVLFTLQELLRVIGETVYMIQSQDSFTKLKSNNIHYN